MLFDITSNPLLQNENSVNPQIIRFVFKAINMCQVHKVLGTFKKSKGSGADGFATYLFNDWFTCNYSITL